MSTAGSNARLLAPTAERKHQLHALTGLRFFAALHVLALHAWIILGLTPQGVPAWAVNLIGNGYLGVPLFFLLSGFVMSYSYLNKPGVARISLDAKSYWAARVARIYPVYLLSLAVALPFLIDYKLQGFSGFSGFAKGTTLVFLNLTLLQSWCPQIINDWVGPAWSLSVEAFFYALFPLIVASIDFSRLDKKALQKALLGLFMLSLALTIAAMLIYQLNPGLDRGSVIGQRCVIPLLRLPDFLAGMALGRLFLLQQWSPSPAAEKPSSLVSLGLTLVILIAMTLVKDEVDHNLVSSLMMPLFMILIYRLACEEGLLSKALATPAAILLGEASYSLYILHFPLLSWIKQGVGGALTTPWTALGLCSLFMTLLSLAVFRFFEAPLRLTLKQHLMKKKAPAERPWSEASPIT